MFVYRAPRKHPQTCPHILLAGNVFTWENRRLSELQYICIAIRSSPFVNVKSKTHQKTYKGIEEIVSANFISFTAERRASHSSEYENFVVVRLFGWLVGLLFDKICIGQLIVFFHLSCWISKNFICQLFNSVWHRLISLTRMLSFRFLINIKHFFKQKTGGTCPLDQKDVNHIWISVEKNAIWKNKKVSLFKN